MYIHIQIYFFKEMHFNFPIFNHFLSGVYMSGGIWYGGYCPGVFVRGICPGYLSRGNCPYIKCGNENDIYLHLHLYTLLYADDAIIITESEQDMQTAIDAVFLIL